MSGEAIARRGQVTCPICHADLAARTAGSAQRLGKRPEAENEHRQYFASHPARGLSSLLAPVFYPRPFALRSAHPPSSLPPSVSPAFFPVLERVRRGITRTEIYTGARIHRPCCDPGAAFPLD